MRYYSSMPHVADTKELRRNKNKDGIMLACMPDL
jgi:hypothetical protein